MSDIDWSKAPEGATHWATHKGIERRWHKIEADSLYFFGSLREWIKYEKETSFVAEIRESLVARPEAVQVPPVDTVCEAFWSGEGLPPVGITAYCTLTEENHLIVAHDIVSSEKMALTCDNDGYWGTDEHHWKPIQTEEEKYQDTLDNAARDYCGRIGVGLISVGAFKAGAQWQKEYKQP